MGTMRLLFFFEADVKKDVFAAWHREVLKSQNPEDKPPHKIMLERMALKMLSAGRDDLIKVTFAGWVSLYINAIRVKRQELKRHSTYVDLDVRAEKRSDGSSASALREAAAPEETLE